MKLAWPVNSLAVGKLQHVPTAPAIASSPSPQRGSAARVRKSGQASAKSLDVNKREEDGQSGTLGASHRYR